MNNGGDVYTKILNAQKRHLQYSLSKSKSKIDGRNETLFLGGGDFHLQRRTSKSSIDVLVDDVLLKIFELCDDGDMVSISLVCKEWALKCKASGLLYRSLMLDLSGSSKDTPPLYLENPGIARPAKYFTRVWPQGAYSEAKAHGLTQQAVIWAKPRAPFAETLHLVALPQACERAEEILSECLREWGKHGRIKSLHLQALIYDLRQWHNPARGPRPLNGLASMTSLIQLEITAFRFDGDLDLFLTQFPNLMEFKCNVRGFRIKDSHRLALSASGLQQDVLLKKLRRISFHDVSLEEPCLTFPWGHLESLELWGWCKNTRYMGEKGLVHLNDSLTSLHIRDGAISVVDDWVMNLKNLEVLNLANNELVRLAPSLSRLTRLRSLDISGNDLRCLPPCLPRLTALTFLNLSYMPHLQLEETDEVDAAPVYYNRARQKLGLCKIVMRHLPRLNNLLAHQNKQAPWSQESAKELEQVSECWHIQGIWSPDKKKTIAF